MLSVTITMTELQDACWIVRNTCHRCFRFSLKSVLIMYNKSKEQQNKKDITMISKPCWANSVWMICGWNLRFCEIFFPLWVNILTFIHFLWMFSDWVFFPHPHQPSPLSLSLPGGVLLVMPWAKYVCYILQNVPFCTTCISIYMETVQLKTQRLHCKVKIRPGQHTRGGIGYGSLCVDQYSIKCAFKCNMSCSQTGLSRQEHPLSVRRQSVSQTGLLVHCITLL